MGGTPLITFWAILSISCVPTPLSNNFLRRSTVSCLLVNLQCVKYTCLIFFPASNGSAASLARYSILEVILTIIVLNLFSLTSSLTNTQESQLNNLFIFSFCTTCFDHKALITC